jgi:hypothetical protein
MVSIYKLLLFSPLIIFGTCIHPIPNPFVTFSKDNKAISQIYSKGSLFSIDISSKLLIFSKPTPSNFFIDLSIENKTNDTIEVIPENIFKLRNKNFIFLKINFRSRCYSENIKSDTIANASTKIFPNMEYYYRISYILPSTLDSKQLIALRKDSFQLTIGAIFNKDSLLIPTQNFTLKYRDIKK